MRQPDWAGPLDAAHAAALTYLQGLPERPVGVRTTRESLLAALGGELPVGPQDPTAVVRDLAAAADPGLVAGGSGRFFGFVIGGALPAALAADWLTSTWDQNAGLYATSPAAAVVEEVAAGWLLRLLGLPAESSVGFVTGAQLATVTCLAAARHELLARDGWDVEVNGLAGSPPITVLAGALRHHTIDRGLRLLGLGTACIVSVDADDQGRMRPDALAAALAAASGPVIVCAQVGQIDTGAADPMTELCELAHAAGAWVHVDGAFGLWAAASPRRRGQVAGVELADSWTTDAHKWLNVPYDSGIAIVRHPAAHRAAMSVRASYLVHAESGERDAVDYNPEFSRRARGFAVYAALRSLGVAGVADLVDRACDLATRFAERLKGRPELTVLNEVVLNQVLVDLHDVDAYEVAQRVRQAGTCYLTATRWQGRPALRISVSNWSTEESDVDSSVEALLAAVHGQEVPA